MELLLLIMTGAALISCSHNTEVKKNRKEELNRIQKGLCILRLRYKGCYEWMQEHQT